MTLERKPIKQRKCKECRKPFIPDRPFIVWCSPECGAELAKKKIARSNELKARKQRKEYREAKERIKSRGDWLREAQIAFNAWIRARDEGLACISCGSHTGKQNAGHYRSVGSTPSLRFEPLNCHLQCEKCNSYLSGNLINYRIQLIQRIGLEKVEWLEQEHPPKHYTVDEIKEIKRKYSALARELKNSSSTY